ncbi:MAG: hypothetical protein PHH90_09980, partial [Limnochordia bacterium]|nr:hypothetical protein [Limnochordia bacterium]
IEFGPPVRGNILSIREITIPGIRIQEPFLQHVGIGSGNGEAWLPSEGERLKLDVLIPIYTDTFTWVFDQEQEYLVIERLVDYRDWVEQVIGHNLTEDFHLALVDVNLSRSEISEREQNRFWLSPTDVWSNLALGRINPSDYDLVWSLWAWKNLPNAQQMYGGAAQDGPANTPFMSFSVSQLTESTSYFSMVLEHEAQHTFESLFHHTGQVVDTTLPLRGFPHADFLDTFIEEMLRREPGLFEPFMSDAEAIQYRRDGPREWPGMTMQRTVNAWTHRQQPRERYLNVADDYGELVPARDELVVQPLFASISIVTDRGPQREVFLPVRVREKGFHVESAQVTATVGNRVYILEKDAYWRCPDNRMPRQERWSIGWDGHAYYGTWVTLDQDTTVVEIKVSGNDINEEFTVPVRYVFVEEDKVVLNDTDHFYEGDLLSEGESTRIISEGSSLTYRVPMSNYDTSYIEVVGSGWLDVGVSATGKYYLSTWTGELGREPVVVGIRPELVKDQDYVYVRLRLPQSHKRPASAETTSRVTDIAVVSRTYIQE